MGKIAVIGQCLRHYISFADYNLVRIAFKKKGILRDDRVHLEAAIRWLCRAQDVFNDGGVARSFSMVYHPYFKRKGWISSYPETTGYIIPTMFDCAREMKSQELYDRACQMADWECDVQLENGAVKGGTIDQKPTTAAVFNTGQVIFGWLRAFQETRQERFLNSAIKAGQFLVGQQDEDGAWRKSASAFTSSRMEFRTYNTRTAWALLELSQVCGEAAFADAAVANIEFALKQQKDNGWFESNCLSDPTQPLLHTIAYCIRGIMEVGAALNEQRYVERARKAADQLIRQQIADGSLAGRFNEKWEHAVSWSCLTGDAQMAIIWGRLYQITMEGNYLDAHSQMNKYLKKVQLLHIKNRDIFGGLCGSDPVSGPYGKYEILNWAVKFFVDALLLEKSIKGSQA